jgi:hypothetical protein
MQQLATNPRPRRKSPGAASAKAARGAVRHQFNAQLRAHLLERNPIAWFALRWRGKSTAAWAIGAVALAGFVSTGITGNLEIFVTPEFALFICYFFNAGLKMHVATQASLALARDRAENSLELLLATPVTPDELVQGHLIALREPLRKLVRSAMLIQAVWLALTLAVRGKLTQDTALCAVAGVAMLAFLRADLFAVGWAALWEGAVAKDSRTACSNAQMKVLFLPWLLLFGLLPLAGIAGWLANPWFDIGVLVVGSAMADLWFGRRAQQKLRTELPQLALSRAAGEVEYYGDWLRWGRRFGQFLAKRVYKT